MAKNSIYTLIFCNNEFAWKWVLFWFLPLKNFHFLKSSLVCIGVGYSWVRNNAKAETPVLWPLHAKSWLVGKDSDAGRDWGQAEKGTTEEEMAGWHHWLNGCESQWAPGVGDGQGGLGCCGSWGRKESDMTEQLIWSDLIKLSNYLTIIFFSVCYCLSLFLSMHLSAMSKVYVYFSASRHTMFVFSYYFSNINDCLAL